jgi:hypothetical protein
MDQNVTDTEKFLEDRRISADNQGSQEQVEDNKPLVRKNSNSKVVYQTKKIA